MNHRPLSGMPPTGQGQRPGAPTRQEAAAPSFFASPIPPDPYKNSGVASAPLAAPTPPATRTRPLLVDLRTIRVPARAFRRATGLNLKLRFLLALTFLSLAPAFLLVLLIQQTEQQTVRQFDQQALHALAQDNLLSFRQELQRRQTLMDTLTTQGSLVQVSQGNASAGAIQNAQNTLALASQTTGDSIAWLLLNASDHVLAAYPSSFLGQDLASNTVVSSPLDLEKFVQAGRAAPPADQGNPPLQLAIGQDHSASGHDWVALESFFLPKAAPTSAVLLAVFSLTPALQPYLHTVSSQPTSYTLVVDEQNWIVGGAGDAAIQKQVGSAVTTVPLMQFVRTLRASGQTGAGLVEFHDPVTGAQSLVSGAVMEGGLICLVVTTQDELGTQTSGVLSPRNLPIIFLALTVVAILAAAAVALPIVRPIRGATREITKTRDDVRDLAGKSLEIAKNQRVGTEILTNAAHGLRTRAGAIRRDEELIRDTISRIITGRFNALAPVIGRLPVDAQEEAKQLLSQMYMELQQAQTLAGAIVSSLTQDRALNTLQDAMEGAGEISDQFEQASKRLHEGAARLDRASEALL